MKLRWTAVDPSDYFSVDEKGRTLIDREGLRPLERGLKADLESDLELQVLRIHTFKLSSKKQGRLAHALEHDLESTSEGWVRPSVFGSCNYVYVVLANEY